MRLNVSRIKDWDWCPQYQGYRWEEKRVRVGGPGRALWLGSRVHEVLAAAMEGKDGGKVVEGCKEEDEAQAKALDVAVEVWKGKIKPWERVLMVEEALETRVGGFDVETGMNWTTKRTEPVVVFGRPDAVVVWRDKVWHVQHKTVGAGVPVAVFSKGVKRSLHELMYAKMLKEKWPKMAYGGTMLNVVRKLGAKAMERDPGAALHMEFVPVGEAAIKRACGDVRLVAREIWEGDERGLYQNRASCVGRFGNSLCPYYGVCEGDEAIEGPGFEDKDPLEGYGDGS